MKNVGLHALTNASEVGTLQQCVCKERTDALSMSHTLGVVTDAIKGHVRLVHLEIQGLFPRSPELFCIL